MRKSLKCQAREFQGIFQNHSMKYDSKQIIKSVKKIREFDIKPRLAQYYCVLITHLSSVYNYFLIIIESLQA